MVFGKGEGVGGGEEGAVVMVGVVRGKGEELDVYMWMLYHSIALASCRLTSFRLFVMYILCYHR